MLYTGESLNIESFCVTKIWSYEVIQAKYLKKIILEMCVSFGQCATFGTREYTSTSSRT